MDRSTKAAALTSGLLWGGALLCVGLVNLLRPSYGRDFLRLTRSVYPGANAERNVGRVLLGAAYGFADGFAAGYFFSTVHRALSSENGQAVQNRS